MRLAAFSLAWHALREHSAQQQFRVAAFRWWAQQAYFHHPVTQQKQLSEMFFLSCALCGKGLRMGLGWAFAVNTVVITAL